MTSIQLVLVGDSAARNKLRSVNKRTNYIALSCLLKKKSWQLQWIVGPSLRPPDQSFWALITRLRGALRAGAISVSGLALQHSTVQREGFL